MGSNAKKIGTAEQEEIEALREKFNSIWTEMLAEILSDFKHVPKVAEWLEYIMDMNVTGGKQSRALAALTLYNTLVPESEREEDKLCYILGWCAEISHTAALMADDIMDDSETRRGIPCWYKRPNVGLSAINDSFILENLPYFMLYKYFADKPYFNRLLKHFHDINLKTIVGQTLDTRCSIEFELQNCTLELYKQIVAYKTSYYTFYLPAATALIMAEMADDETLAAVEKVALLTGYLFQVQDDYMDCFGDPKITGKIGTDIKDSKCTWLLVKALELSNETQQNIIRTCYGKKSDADEAAVKQIYRELGLVQVYRLFEDETRDQIHELIHDLPAQLPRQPFITALNAMHGRRH